MINGQRRRGDRVGMRPGLPLDPIMVDIYVEMQLQGVGWSEIEVSADLGLDALRLKYYRGHDLRLGEARRVLEYMGMTLKAVPIEEDA